MDNLSFLEDKQRFSVVVKYGKGEFPLFGRKERVWKRGYNLVVATPEQFGIYIPLGFSDITENLYERSIEKGLGTVPQAVSAEFAVQNHQVYGGNWDGSFLIAAAPITAWKKGSFPLLRMYMSDKEERRDLMKDLLFTGDEYHVSPKSRWLWVIK